MNKNNLHQAGFWLRLLILVLLVAFVAPIVSQAESGTEPDTMNFQGRLLDSSGNPLSDAYRCMRVRICSDGESEATCNTSQQWPESSYEYHTVQTESGSYKAGLFSVALGSAIALPPGLFHAYDELYLEIGVGAYDLNCTIPLYTVLEPRSRLHASAYALRSRRVHTIESDDDYLISVQNNGTGGGVEASVQGTESTTTAGSFTVNSATGPTRAIMATNISSDDNASAGHFLASNEAGQADALKAESAGGYALVASGGLADVVLTKGEIHDGEFAGGLDVRSHGGVTVHLDKNADESANFSVRNDADTVVFSIDETGAMTGGTHNHNSSYSLLSHTHWGESWSGSGTGLTLTGTNSQGIGMHGVGQSASGVNPSIALGLWGDTNSGIGVLGYTSSTGTDMSGVSGAATATTGKTFGVWGQTSSSTENAGGGYFKAASASGKTYGVHAETFSSTDWASGGKFAAKAATGKTFGVYAENSSTSNEAAAGHFRALGGSGKTYGIYAENNSSSEDAEAGRFISMPSSGKTRTIYVDNNSTTDGSGAGWFSADGGSGAVYGVFARTNSTTDDARAGWFYAEGTSGKTQAVQATNYSTTNDAAAGSFFEEGGSGETYGVYAEAKSYLGTGVYGYGRGGVGGKFVSYNGNLIEGWEEPTIGVGPTELRFRVHWNGEVYADGSYNTPAADFAELLPAGENLEPGDVLAVGLDGQLIRSDEAYQPSVVGVHSTKPGFLGGVTEDVDHVNKIPLAVVGVVPVKVSAENGAIQPGDLLVASDTPGHAMRAGEEPPQGTVIGKALASLQQDAGVIQMLATLQ